MICMDVGNSNIRAALFVDQKIHKLVHFATPNSSDANQIPSSAAAALSMDIDTYASMPVFVSSVVGFVRHALQKLPQHHMIDAHSPKNFEILRVAPDTLGSDIIAGTQRTVDAHPLPCIVIDAGTATTVTFVNKHKQFEGGVICPGLGICASALTQSADALPQIELVIPPSVIGTTTQEAMQAGLIFGHAGMIQSLVAQIKEEKHANNASVILTGGSASLLHPILPETYILDKTLVLEGIASIASMILSR